MFYISNLFKLEQFRYCAGLNVEWLLIHLPRFLLKQSPPRHEVKVTFEIALFVCKQKDCFFPKYIFENVVSISIFITLMA